MLNISRRVKKWQGGDMKLLLVEERFRRVKGYREIPQLMAAIHATAPPGQARPVAVG